MTRVSHADLQAMLSARRLDWSTVAHVAATTTLARAIRRTGAVGVPVATLRDFAVLPWLPGEMALPLGNFWDGSDRTSSGVSTFEQRVSAWQSQATGRRMRIAIQVDDSLRRFVRESADELIGRALLASRRSYAASIHSLIDSGVRPGDVDGKSVVARLAREAWAVAEVEVPALPAPRLLTWFTREELHDEGSQRLEGLHCRLRAALAAAFGGPPMDQRRTIVHHGFYYYSPAQWQFFQLLRSIPEVDQVFVVHDDGSNPAFATWRYFFRPEWDMPVPHRYPDQPLEETSGASAWLRAQLTGVGTGALDNVKLVNYRSPIELAREWTSEQDASSVGDERGATARYAARAADIDRLVGRLGETGRSPQIQLSQLPVGLFLIALHESIQRLPGRHPRVVLTPQRLLDMVGSGYVTAPGAAPIRLATLRRVLPYFRGCTSASDWRDRARLFRTMVADRVDAFGGRRLDQDDVERIALAAENPLRLAPWVDLTPEDVLAVVQAVEVSVGLIEEVARRERVVLGPHLGRIHDMLRQALDHMPEEHQKDVEGKLKGFSILAEEEVDVDALVDVVAMLVGRVVDIDIDVDKTEPTDLRSVSELRGLDVLGFRRSTTPIHLANLSEDKFPSGAPSVGWPFEVADLKGAIDLGLEPVVLEIFETRTQTAALGDLYLLWLALDGTEPGTEVTLSWISESAGEKHRLAPVVALLGRLEHHEAIARVGDGLKPELPATRAQLEPLGERPQPLGTYPPDPRALERAAESIPPSAGASAVACSRRFALQWALGPSTGFEPEYLTTMLMGNVIHFLRKTGRTNVFGAAALGGSMWPQLTEAQRQSSLDKAVVRPEVRGLSARPEWVWSLEGRAQGSRPLDLAYRASTSERRLAADELAPEDAEFLPLGMPDDGQHSADTCSRCPVQSRCLQRQFGDR